MSAIKLVGLTIAFVVTGGILFSEYFRSNKWVRGAAAVVAMIATIYLVLELRGDLFGERRIETGSIRAPEPQPKSEGDLTTIVAPLADRLKVGHVSFSPDGHSLRIGAPESVVLTWNRNTNAARTSKNLLKSGKLGAAPDGQSIVQYDRDGNANITDVQSGSVTSALLPPLPANEYVGQIAVSSNRAYLAIASYTIEAQPKDEKGKINYLYKPHLRIYNLTTKKNVCHDDIYHRDYISDLAFSNDGSLVVTASLDSGVRLFTLTCRHTMHLRGYKYTNAAALDAGGKRAASAGYDGTILYKQLRDYAEGAGIGFLVDARRLTFDHRGLYLAAGTNEGWIYLFDSGTGMGSANARGHTGKVINFAFAPDSSVLASAGEDGVVVLFEVPTLKRLATLHMFSDGQWVVLLESGEFCASSEGERWLRVRRVVPGRLWNSTIDEPLSAAYRAMKAIKSCSSS